MPPEDYLQLARDLLATPNSAERHWRGAAHAAYFAVLNLLALHLKVDLTQKGTNHETVRQGLMGVPHAQAPRFVRLAKVHWISLSRYRIRADYHLRQQFTRRDAENARDLAEAIFVAFPN